MVMRLLGRDKLEELKRYEPSSKNWIDAWSTELSLSNWKSKEEVKKHFPKVENIGDQTFVFKVDCCASYVETIIDFNRLLVFVTSVKGNDNGY
ncbi:type II toxin-antitoxin system HigB family toxin [Klebsiella pneumoniae]